MATTAGKTCAGTTKLPWVVRRRVKGRTLTREISTSDVTLTMDDTWVWGRVKLELSPWLVVLWPERACTRGNGGRDKNMADSDDGAPRKQAGDEKRSEDEHA